MRTLLCFLMMCFGSVWASDIAGLYTLSMDNDESYIEVFQRDGKYYAVGFGNKSGVDSGNDIKNPNPKLRDRKIGGSVFLWNLTHKEGDTYHGGRIYNFKNGQTYYVRADYVNDTLKLRASKDKKGSMGKTILWKKMSAAEAEAVNAKRIDTAKLQLPK